MKSRKWRKKDFGNRGENSKKKKKKSLNHDRIKRQMGRQVKLKKKVDGGSFVIQNIDAAENLENR